MAEKECRCVSCGTPLEWKGNGRPPTRCPDCKAAMGRGRAKASRENETPDQREARIERQREYRQRNAPAVRARQARYRAEHREEIREYQAIRREERRGL